MYAGRVLVGVSLEWSSVGTQTDRSWWRFWRQQLSLASPTHRSGAARMQPKEKTTPTPTRRGARNCSVTLPITPHPTQIRRVARAARPSVLRTGFPLSATATTHEPSLQHPQAPSRPAESRSSRRTTRTAYEYIPNRTAASTLDPYSLHH